MPGIEVVTWPTTIGSPSAGVPLFRPQPSPAVAGRSAADSPPPPSDAVAVGSPPLRRRRGGLAALRRRGGGLAPFGRGRGGLPTFGCGRSRGGLATGLCSLLVIAAAGGHDQGCSGNRCTKPTKLHAVPLCRFPKSTQVLRTSPRRLPCRREGKRTSTVVGRARTGVIAQEVFSAQSLRSLLRNVSVG